MTSVADSPVRETLASVHTDLFVDGRWVPAASGDRFEVVNPATEEVLARVADADASDARRAIEVAAAHQACLLYTSPSPRDRG